MYLLLFKSLEVFVRALTALPGNHSVLFTSMQPILPIIDAIPAFVHNLFSEISENTLFPIQSIKSVVVVINFFKSACFFFEKKQTVQQNSVSVSGACGTLRTFQVFLFMQLL